MQKLRSRHLKWSASLASSDSEIPASEGKKRSLAGLRHQARHYALQALYQRQMTGQSAADITAQFLADNDFSRADQDYFIEALEAVIAGSPALDARYQPYLTERSLDELGLVERAALRLGAWELLERLDIPYRVAINEAVSLAKKFGAADSHKFVNAVLDKLAQEVRRAEIEAGR